MCVLVFSPHTLYISSCNDTSQEWKLPIQAEILSSEDGDYTLKEVSFQTLKDPIRMQGDYGSGISGASLNLDTNVEEIIISGDPKSIYANLAVT